MYRYKNYYWFALTPQSNQIIITYKHISTSLCHQKAPISREETTKDTAASQPVNQLSSHMSSMNLALSKSGSNDKNLDETVSSESKEALKKSTTTPRTYQDQVLENLRMLIDKSGETGMRLLSMGQAYGKEYGKQLEFEMFGYNSSSTFVLENLAKHYRIVKAPDTFGDYTFYARTKDELEQLEKQQQQKQQAQDEFPVEQSYQKLLERKKKLDIFINFKN